MTEPICRGTRHDETPARCTVTHGHDDSHGYDGIHDTLDIAYDDHPTSSTGTVEVHSNIDPPPWLNQDGESIVPTSGPSVLRQFRPEGRLEAKSLLAVVLGPPTRQGP
jgi:hypothetical protein